MKEKIETLDEVERKKPTAIIVLVVVLLVGALVGGYYLGNENVLKLRKEEINKIDTDSKKEVKLEEKKVETTEDPVTNCIPESEVKEKNEEVVKNNIPANDLYTFEYSRGDDVISKGYFSMFLVVDGELYYKAINNVNQLHLIRTVDNSEYDKKDLNKVDTSAIGKIRRLKGFVYDDRLLTFIITESGKVYSTSFNETTGNVNPLNQVNDLKDYEVDDIKSFSLEVPESHYEIILKNGETVKK